MLGMTSSRTPAPMLARGTAVRRHLIRGNAFGNALGQGLVDAMSSDQTGANARSDLNKFNSENDGEYYGSPAVSSGGAPGRWDLPPVAGPAGALLLGGGGSASVAAQAGAMAAELAGGAAPAQRVTVTGQRAPWYERALYQTSVTGMRWDDDAARWWVSTDRGDTFRARFVTTQSGIFSRPQLPGIEGLESFQGKMFHSARWDYDYTGGDTFGGLAHLADKRVGLLGTGTTALQVVPEVAKCARHLTVFQRTPTAVGVRDNGPTDSKWFSALPPGWQRQREITFNRLANGELIDIGIA